MLVSIYIVLFDVLVIVVGGLTMIIVEALNLGIHGEIMTVTTNVYKCMVVLV